MNMWTQCRIEDLQIMARNAGQMRLVKHMEAVMQAIDEQDFEYAASEMKVAYELVQDWEKVIESEYSTLSDKIEDYRTDDIEFNTD